MFGGCAGIERRAYYDPMKNEIKAQTAKVVERDAKIAELERKLAVAVAAKAPVVVAPTRVASMDEIERGLVAGRVPPATVPVELPVVVPPPQHVATPVEQMVANMPPPSILSQGQNTGNQGVIPSLAMATFAPNEHAGYIDTPPIGWGTGPGMLRIKNTATIAIPGQYRREYFCWTAIEIDGIDMIMNRANPIAGAAATMAYVWDGGRVRLRSLMPPGSTVYANFASVSTHSIHATCYVGPPRPVLIKTKTMVVRNKKNEEQIENRTVLAYQRSREYDRSDISPPWDFPLDEFTWHTVTATRLP